MNFFQENVGARGLLAEAVRCLANAALDDVVPQHDADLLPVGEMFSKTKRVRNAAFAFLVGIVNVVQAPLLTVGQQSQKVAGISASGDDQDVAHTGINQRLYR